MYGIRARGYSSSAEEHFIFFYTRATRGLPISAQCTVARGISLYMASFPLLIAFSVVVVGCCVPHTYTYKTAAVLPAPHAKLHFGPFAINLIIFLRNRFLFCFFFIR